MAKAGTCKEQDVDVVLVVRNRQDLSSFLEAWRSILHPYHLIIIGLFEQREQVTIPPPFRSFDLYTHQDVANTLGAGLLQNLMVPPPSDRRPYLGPWKCLGFLLSRKRFVYTIDADCTPIPLREGVAADPVQGHFENLNASSTPFFFNTLYDPYRKGADFVRGYPFSLREGVPCALSQGLWLNTPDFDAPTQIVKSSRMRTNLKYVDAVLTVPRASLFPLSSINMAFDRKLVGITMFFCGGLCGSTRYESLDDIWAGLCCKVICDHLGYGMKSGLPYVERRESQDSNALENLMSGTEPKAVHWLEELIPFFQNLCLPRTTLSVEDCYKEITKQVKEGKLDHVDPLFGQVGDAMESWIEAWKTLSST